MTLPALLRAIVAFRWRIAAVTLLLVAGGGMAILLWPRSYVAQATVAPAETTAIATSSLLAPAPFAAGGLLDPRPGGNFAVYLSALRGVEAAAMLTRETPLLAHLTERRGAGPMGAIRRALGLRIEADLDDAATWLDRSLAVTQDLTSITWTLALPHRDRVQGLDALARLHAFAEAKVRADIAALAAARAAALERRLAAETDLHLRSMLYDLLGQAQRAGLIAQVDTAVAARLVDPPSVEIRPSLPNRPLLLVLLLVAAPLASLLGAACVVLLREPAPGPRLGGGLGGLRERPAEPP